MRPLCAQHLQLWSFHLCLKSAQRTSRLHRALDKYVQCPPAVTPMSEQHLRCVIPIYAPCRETAGMESTSAQDRTSTTRLPFRDGIVLSSQPQIASIHSAQIMSAQPDLEPSVHPQHCRPAWLCVILFVYRVRVNNVGLFQVVYCPIQVKIGNEISCFERRSVLIFKKVYSDGFHARIGRQRAQAWPCIFSGCSLGAAALHSSSTSLCCVHPGVRVHGW